MSGYGAVDTNEPDAEQEEKKEFGESSIYYLKDEPVTKEERLRKLALICFPILIAALVLGLFTTWILHSSGILNTGEHGTRSSDFTPVTSYSDPMPAPASAPVTISTPAASKPALKGSTGGSASCSKNSGCEELGLEGDCCPTAAGIMLGCCS